MNGSVEQCDKAQCRACLSKENLQNIRESYVVGRTVYSIFCECTGINQMDSDCVQLCAKCQFVLIQFYELKCRVMNHFDQFLFENVKYEIESTEIKIKEEVLEEEPDSEKCSYSKKSSNHEVSCLCPQCLKPHYTFKNAQKCMNFHITANNGLKCDYCGKNYQRNDLAVHIRRVHLRDFNEIFSCDICDRTFTHKNSVDNHKRYTHKTVINKFKCAICLKEFRQKTRLDHHARTKHIGILEHHCALCNKSFSSADCLKNHLRAIHISEKFTCSYCGKQFSHKSNCITHEKLHKINKYAEYFCDECGFITNTQNNLKRHIQVHSDVKRYVCSTCGAKFRTSVGLRLHNFTHEAKSFSCHVCQKLFRRSHHVKTHIELVHLREKKKYNCDSCGEEFTQKVLCQKHVKSCSVREN